MTLFRFVDRSRNDRAPSRRRRVVIGVDFGTSSIKIAFRDLTDQKAPVGIIDFGTQHFGYSRFAFPSTIAERDGLLLVGEEAELANGGVVQRSIKMALLEADNSDQMHVEHHLEFFASVLVAAALCRARPAIKRALADEGDIQFLYNIDVPVSRYESLEPLFLRILRQGIRLSKSIALPCRVDVALAQFREVSAEVAAEPYNPQTSPETVVGETQAILGGIGDALDLQENRPYVVIDVGAGTTDIGIFFFSEWNGERRVNFFSAATCETGCDQIDERICVAAFGNVITELLHQIRIAKSALSRNRKYEIEKGGESHVLLPQHLHTAVQHLARPLQEHYIDAWRSAYGKAKSIENWTDAGLVVVGGGSMIPGIHHIFANAQPGATILESTVLLSIPKASQHLRVVGASDVLPAGDELPFLTAARGLSYGLIELRRLVTPAEIRPIVYDRNPTGQFAVDADDYYAK